MDRADENLEQYLIRTKNTLGQLEKLWLIHDVVNCMVPAIGI